jgi:PAS domain S-box-containing protein
VNWDGIVVEPQGELLVKGKTQPVNVYAVQTRPTRSSQERAERGRRRGGEGSGPPGRQRFWRRRPWYGHVIVPVLHRRAALTARRDLALRLSGPRARAVVACLVAAAAEIVLNAPIRDWQDRVPVAASAIGVTIAVLAGGFGGVVAGIATAGVGWGLNAIFVADRVLDALIALPAWLAAGAFGGWFATRLRRAASDRAAELRAATDRVGELEAQYRALTEVLPVVTYLRSSETGAPLFLSPQAERLLGYSADEILRDPDLFPRLVHPDDRDRATAAGGETRSLEYRLLARDGRVVWVRDEALTVRDARGDPLCIEGYLLDVSDAKTADDERKQLRTATTAAEAEAAQRRRQVDFVARAGALLVSSLEYRNTTGELAALAVKELADWCVIDQVDEDGSLTRLTAARAEPPRMQEEPGSTPEPEATEVVRQRRSRISGARIVVPIVSHGGTTLGALTLAVDGKRRAFTSYDLSWAEALAAMMALAMDLARLRGEVEARAEATRVLTYVGEGVFLLDRSGVIRLWNPRARAITGVSAEAALGNLAVEAFPGWERISQRVPTGAVDEDVSAEALPLDTEQGERWISISGVDFFGGTVYAFRDITDEHRLEELQADFISTASHELRTPLAAVYGAAQTLRRHDFALDEAGRARFISLIVEESERLRRIVDQILLANQLDVGRLDLVTEAFDAPELLERVAEATRTHAPAHLKITVASSEDVPPVAADKDRVRQILINLVENAIKYSPKPGTIELGVETFEGVVLFRVLDEGLGIPAEEQARIFDKFYRLDPDMTRGIGGTGLGLYICKELVERMGGRIWVESRREKGSAFFFDLPTVGTPLAGARTREPSRADRAG